MVLPSTDTGPQATSTKETEEILGAKYGGAQSHPRLCIKHPEIPVTRLPIRLTTVSNPLALS